MIADILTHIMNAGLAPFSALNGVLRSCKRFSLWPIDRAPYAVETVVRVGPQHYTMRAYPNGYRVSAIVDNGRLRGVSTNYEGNALKSILSLEDSTLTHVKLGVWISWRNSEYYVRTHNGISHEVTVDLATRVCQYRQRGCMITHTDTIIPDAPIAQRVLSLMRAGDTDAACAAVANQFGADDSIAGYVAATLCEALR